jgi:hypothetical protein
MPSAEHRPGTCEVIASVCLAGAQDTNVRAVVDAASRTGRGYIAVRVGQALLYLEDRVAFDALAGAVRTAAGHAAAVYGEPRDAFSLTEARARRNFEKGRQHSVPRRQSASVRSARCSIRTGAHRGGAARGNARPVRSGGRGRSAATGLTAIPLTDRKAIGSIST